MMQVTLTAELEEFVNEQVKAGRFASATDVVEAALTQFMVMPEVLDAETLAAIDRADAEFERGEDRPFSEVAAELRQRYLSR